MFADKLFEEFNGLSLEGYKLSDAIVIHTQNDLFLNMQDFEHVRKDVEQKSLNHLKQIQKSINNGVKNNQLSSGEAGFFDTPECIPPFQNILFQNDNKTCVWLIDITSEIGTRTDTIHHKYALIFFPAIGSSYELAAIERLDIYISKNGFFDFGEAYAKKRNGDPERFAFEDKVIAITIASCALRILSIINCKNIELVTNTPSKKLNKKRIKKKKLPLCSYYTLAIKPVGKKSNEQASQGLWNNRVHICRGHFKTYTKEKPLFGTTVGRFWWQPSVRGNSKEGMIVKDYKIGEVH